MVSRSYARAVGGLAMVLSVNIGAVDNLLGPNTYTSDKLPPELLKQAEAISRQGKQSAQTLVNQGQTDWVKPLAHEAVMRELKVESSQQDSAPEQDYKTLIFVSWSLGASAIKDILKLYDGRQGLAVIFRGIPEKTRMADAVAQMHKLTQETQSNISVLIDPLAFQRHQVQLVPTVVIERPDQSLLAKITGISSIQYLEDALKDGQQGDLGVMGSPKTIKEPDLLTVAKARIETINWEEQQNRAKSRFWHVHKGYPLPTATQNAVHNVDPSVLIPQDIRDTQGRIVAKAGLINPLHLLPFHQKLVVIDPTQSWQVALAKQEYAQRGPLTVTVMATHIPPEAGWLLFENTQDRINGPLYLLPADLARRFQIEKVPSVVTAEGDTFVVKEFASFQEEKHGLK